jgi:hypothetical protein
MVEDDGGTRVRTSVERDQWGTNWIVECEQQDDGMWIETSRIKASTVAAAERIRARGTGSNASLKPITFAVASTSTVTKVHAWELDSAGDLWFVTFEVIDGNLQQTNRVRARAAAP